MLNCRLNSIDSDSCVQLLEKYSCNETESCAGNKCTQIQFSDLTCLDSSIDSTYPSQPQPSDPIQPQGPPQPHPTEPATDLRLATKPPQDSTTILVPVLVCVTIIILVIILAATLALYWRFRIKVLKER